MNSRTQIVVTVGPACGGVPIISKMLASGMDAARVNFSHGTHESNGGYIKNAREAARLAGRRIPVIQDLSGPRVTTETGHGFGTGEPIVTEKDLSDLNFGISAGVDYVAQSFIGRAEDIALLRSEMEKRGAKIPIIAKIERRAAVENLDEILAEADAIMIARGDLRAEIPQEEVPFLEKELIAKARAAGKPVIVATQMMYSMAQKPEPTSAEVTDVAYAVLLSADAVMLSDETATGKYPVETVAMMERIVSRAERAAEEGRVNAL